MYNEWSITCKIAQLTLRGAVVWKNSELCTLSIRVSCPLGRMSAYLIELSRQLELTMYLF